jgi:hypothetical protein
VTQLGKELTATYIEQELNRQNCFDFEFEPQEGDVVSFRFNELLSKRDDQSYMSFEYSHGHWEIRPFHPLTFSVSKEIGAGKVDIIDK